MAILYKKDMEEEYNSKMEKRRQRSWKHLFRSTERNNLFLLANSVMLEKTLYADSKTSEPN